MQTMNSVYYDSADIYVETGTTLREKIVKVDAIIEALETSALKAAGKNSIQEYTLNDGQTTIRAAYRSASEVEASITAFERIRQRYINRLNGRHMRFVDGKNLS